MRRGPQEALRRAHRAGRPYKQGRAANRVAATIDQAVEDIKRAVARIKSAKRAARRLEDGHGIAYSLDNAIRRIGSAYVELQEAMSELEDME